MINIILAEDHHLVRNGIKTILELQPNLTISGEATNGAEVIKLLEQKVPADVVLADMNMPVVSGLELTEKLHQEYPKLKIIILSALDHEKYVVKAFQLGACGYLLKNVRADELLFAIKHVHEGEQYVCSELTSRFLNRLVALPNLEHSEKVQDLEFTEREIEKLRLISEGYTNQEIADKIFTSKRTVEGLRQVLIDKTGSRNTAALVRFALVNGLIG
jgi:DNA-binding NarL/FixJ family response regulator